jgi:hypothetical protein
VAHMARWRHVEGYLLVRQSDDGHERRLSQEKVNNIGLLCESERLFCRRLISVAVSVAAGRALDLRSNDYSEIESKSNHSI